jgi:hypothetical protein
VLFVDQDETRQKLPFDLKALNIPALNEKSYLIPLSKLISKTWQAFNRKVISQQAKIFEQEKLTLEKEKLDLEKQLFGLQKSGLIDIEKVKDLLRSKKITLGLSADLLSDINFLDVFNIIKYKLADGATTAHITHVLKKHFNIEEDKSQWFTRTSSDDKIQEFVGELIIQGLVKVIPPINDYQPYNILTDLGIKLAREL